MWRINRYIDFNVPVMPHGELKVGLQGGYSVSYYLFIYLFIFLGGGGGGLL